MGGAALDVPRVSACPIKDNVVLLVLGVVDARDPVVLRVALHEDNVRGDEFESEWTGRASLVHRGEVIPIGAITQVDDAKLAAAYRAAQALAAKRFDDFVPAEVVSTQTCGDAGSRTCGRVSLDKGGGVLRVDGKARLPLFDPAVLGQYAPSAARLFDVVVYRAGEVEVVTANLGGGDPRFATQLGWTVRQGVRRSIRTMHHGAHGDALIVLR